MKYLLLSTSIMAATAAMMTLPVTGQQTMKGQFSLSGQIEGVKEGFVYLRYTNKEGKSVVDSSAINSGRFQFRGSIAQPTLVSFYGKLSSRAMEDPNYTSLFLEPAAMKVTVSNNAFKQAKLTGSLSNTEYEGLQKQKRKVSDKWKVVMDTLHAVNKRSNFQYQELKNWVLTPYSAEMNEIDAEFVKTHPASWVTANMLLFTMGYSDDSLKNVYNKFPDKIKQSSYGKAIVADLERRKIGVPGTMASDFTATDINNQPLSLSGLKGKYVLIDFWASWCVPCRKGNPHLKELYTMYKDKGFEVIGVSDDDSNPDAWKAAVEKDGLPWKQILRGMKVTMEGTTRKYDRSKDISDLFNISSLPTQILIDPNGKIIARYGEDGEGHEMLDAKLITAFSNK